MLKIYWWDKPNNFGDVLTPHILTHFGIPWVKTKSLHDANAIMTGSTARLALDDMYILGSGIIRNNEEANPNAKWMWVRGPLTRDNAIEKGCDVPPIYGDPALFLPEIVNPIGKKYECGWIPHYQDMRGFPQVYHEGNPCRTINVVNKNPLDVAREISQCEKIISTSLHGIIVAHAYGIPAARVIISKLHGDGIKFQDHYESVGLKPPKNSLLDRKTKEVHETHFSTPPQINMSGPRKVLKKLKESS